MRWIVTYLPKAIGFGLWLLISPSPATGASPSIEAELDGMLTDFHLAASNANGDRYFSLFAPNAVFLGTSPEERWSLEDFKAYARPFFDVGRGWTYVATSRHIEVAPSGEIAWFDEILDNAKYGTCRGSGVLVKTDGEWKIAQYNLALLVPNEVALDVVELIRGEAGVQE
ncbi:MAG: nuclear transport factor 2 family protein [Thermoanaerobaculia bacterium]